VARHGLDVQGSPVRATGSPALAGVWRRAAEQAEPSDGLRASASPPFQAASRVLYAAKAACPRGVYQSLKAAGSNAIPPMSRKIAAGWRNTAGRRASALGPFPATSRSHSPDAVVATGPWQGAARPRDDAIVPAPKVSPLRNHRRRCGRSDGTTRTRAGDRRGSCGGKAREPGQRGIHRDAMEKLGAERGGWSPRIGPLSPPDSYERRRRCREFRDAAMRRQRRVIHSLGERRQRPMLIVRPCGTDRMRWKRSLLMIERRRRRYLCRRGFYSYRRLGAPEGDGLRPAVHAIVLGPVNVRRSV